jgi:pimeloyl-ACP methyl ester carboxylesterase
VYRFDPGPASPCTCLRGLLLWLQHGPQWHKGHRAQSGPWPVFPPTLEGLWRTATPDQFKEFAAAVGQMQKTEPNYSARDLADIHVPVTIVQSEHDEFIKPEHTEYLSRSIPGAEFVFLLGVSHFAPLQRPEQFNTVMSAFLSKIFC